MTKYTVATHTTVVAAIERLADRLGSEDRGAVTTETAIIVGILAAAAVTLTGVMTGAITNFQNNIPSGP